MDKSLTNIKRKLTTVRNKILKARDFALQEENLSIAKAALEALSAGEKSVEIRYTERGEVRSYVYNHVRMIGSIRPYPLVSEFIEHQTEESYQSLLNGCFRFLMADMASGKYSVKGGSNFDTDICLNILFALAYLNDTYVEALLDKLFYFKQVQLEDGEEESIFFSAHSLLPLVAFIYGDGKNYRLAQLLDASCDANYQPLDPDPSKNVNAVYQKIIENIFSDDVDTFRETILSMCDYHLEKSKDSYLAEFNTLLWQYFPIEILLLLKEGYRKGLPIDGIHHPLLDDFLPYFLTDFKMSPQNKMILQTISD